MDGQSTTKSTITVVNLGVVPTVTGSGMILIGRTYSPPNPTRGKPNGLIMSRSIPICWKAGQYKISAELPLSTRIRWIAWLATVTVTINASSWGITTPRASSSEKDSITDSILAAFIGLCRENTSPCMLLAYTFLAELNSPPSTIPPKMVWISRTTS
jgi:hypothetical protein